MSDPQWVDDTLDAVDRGWWEAQEAADAREESEHGLEPVPSPWLPSWVRLRNKITHGPDEKNAASSSERQEASW